MGEIERLLVVVGRCVTVNLLNFLRELISCGQYETI